MSVGAKKRLRIYARDGYSCLKCGAKEDLTIDHIVPISRGGSDDFQNLQTLCFSCNQKKAADMQYVWWRNPIKYVIEKQTSLVEARLKNYYMEQSRYMRQFFEDNTRNRLLEHRNETRAEVQSALNGIKELALALQTKSDKDMMDVRVLLSGISNTLASYKRESDKRHQIQIHIANLVSDELERLTTK
jgi:CRISPR/Cas system Type II protein with McrA/HNH and RuvC-like nuclease domain